MTDIFFSPHPDDIAYSCFGAIHTSHNKKIIVTVYSVSCYSFNSTLNDVTETTALRKKEDLYFANSENADLMFLDYADSSLTIHNPEKYNNSELDHDIHLVITNNSPSNIFLPIAIGWHIDHINLRNIILSFIKKNKQFVNKVFFYEDLPYACDFTTIDYYNEITKLAKLLDIKISNPIMIDISTYFELWKKMIKAYKSQYNQDEYRRIFDYKSKNGSYFERIWEILV